MIDAEGFRPDYPVKDFHGHWGTFASFNASGAARGTPDDAVRRSGVSEVCIAPFMGLTNDCAEGNRMSAELSGRCSLIRGLCLVDPYDGAETERQLAYCFEDNRFAGIKLHPDYNHVPDNHDGFDAALAYAGRHRLPVLWHYGGGTDYLKELSAKYHGANFVLAHYGTAWDGESSGDVRNILDLVAKLDNVYTDLAGSICFCDALPKVLDLVPSEKILFGSDMCFLDAAYQLGQTLRAKIPDAAKYDILCGNYDRIVNPR